jgi:N-acetylmuramoyl-L-alanine amidase
VRSLLLALSVGCTEPASEPARVPDAPAPSRRAATPMYEHGALSGLAVYLSAGHGFAAHDRGAGYQRPPAQFGLVEDEWTAEFASEHLIPALERAGAVVFTARERDRSPVAVVATAASPSTELRGLAYWERRAPEGRVFRSVANEASARLDPGGVATFTVRAADSGRQQVYARWLASSDADPDATWLVEHRGEAIVVAVDQRSHDSDWYPLVALDVVRGDEVRVTLSGGGAGTLSADGVRLGGGTVRLWSTKYDTWMVRPAYDTAGVHTLWHTGASSRVWAAPGSGAASDATARARWSGWAAEDVDDAVFLSVHTNAGGGSGTQAFVRPGCMRPGCEPTRARSRAYADAVREATVAAMRLADPAWIDRGTTPNDLAEINDLYNPLPAALLEVGFHDSAHDAALLLDPDTMPRLADALVAATARWRDPAAPLPPPRPRVTWRGDWISVEAGDSPWAGRTEGWRVRERAVDGALAARWTVGPNLSVGADVVAVEVSAAGPGGLSAPVWAVREPPVAAAIASPTVADAPSATESP